MTHETQVPILEKIAKTGCRILAKQRRSRFRHYSRGNRNIVAIKSLSRLRPLPISTVNTAIDVPGFDFRALAICLSRAGRIRLAAK